MPYRAGRTTSQKVRPASSFAASEQPMTGELAPGEIAVNVADGALFIGKQDGSAAALPTLVGGKVPASQLPSYVDDVEEYANLAAFPESGEANKIYVAIDSAKTYRWSGSVYVEVSAGSEFDQALNTTDAVTFTSVSLPNATQITVGSFDNSTGGASGLSLHCAVGYELNWQGGRLRSVMLGDATATPQTIYVDSPLAFNHGTAPVPVDAGGVSGTYTTNASASDVFNLTLTGNLTLANPTNPVDGKTVRWRLRQDATGSRTLTLGSKFTIPASATSPLPVSTAANKMDILAATYHAGRDAWDIVAFVPGY